MKKFLWFLVGMAVMISIPVLLFNRDTTNKGTSSRQPPAKGIEIQKDQIKKPDSIGGAKLPAKKTQSPGKGGPSAKQGAY
jgi:hypothetical protein